MMQQPTPLQTTLLTDLKQAAGGIAPQSLRFANITMESDKFICVRDTPAGGESAIVIVEIGSEARTKPSQKIKMQAADSAVMNPSTKVLALKSGQSIQIFNLDMRARMRSTSMAEDVVFMKWLDTVVLALVTPTAVYHWSMEGEQEPRKMFDRLPEMATCTIMNYRCDASLQWLVLIGIGQDPANPSQRKGQAQLYSVAKAVSKAIDAHAACFCNFRLPGNPKHMNIMCITSNNQPNGGQLLLAETPPEGEVATFERVMKALPIDPTDFPIGLHASEKHGCLYLATRLGFVHVIDVHRGELIQSEKLSGKPDPDNCFMSTFSTTKNGVIVINMAGEVRESSINDDTIVKHVLSRGNQPLAMRLAVTADLSGADEVFRQQFENSLAAGKIDAAVRLCAEAPRQMLRTPQELMRFQSMQAPPGMQQTPAAAYFKFMIEHGKLNKYESVELAKILLSKQGLGHVKQYLEEKKFEECEELGDVIAPHDQDLALKIYFQGKAHMKVLNVLINKQSWEHVIKYMKDRGSEISMDWTRILAQICDMRNIEGASALAQKLAADPTIVAGMDHERTVSMFVERQAIKAATAYLLEVLKEDKPEHAALQTKLLEINLRFSDPRVADQILTHCNLTHYDMKTVALMCEQAQLFQRALENYNKMLQQGHTELMDDVKRCVVNTQAINHEWLVEFFLQMTPEQILTIIHELMKANARQNYKICMHVATKNWEILGLQKLIDTFLSFKAFEALYYFLGTIIMSPTQSNPQGCQDPEAHFRYIEAAATVGQMQEVERMTRDSQFYPGERTKNFLKEKRLTELWPFINVCDQHGFIDEMVRFLYDSKHLKYIDMYVQKRQPLKLPLVVGCLLDVDCSIEYIQNLIVSVGSMAPIDGLVDECEKRSRLKLLQPLLEARMHTSEDVNLFNALAKIRVDQNQDARRFLESNIGKYDPKVVGKFCEMRDPNLSVLCYEQGTCDEELVNVTTNNGMWKQQARYLVSRKDKDLWSLVLESEEPARMEARKSLIDALVASAVPEAKNADEVSVCVQAFMQADLPEYLMGMLETLLLHNTGGRFADNKYLQNLLILTAIKNTSTNDKVMDYVQRLDNFDAEEIAQLAANAGLFEEAFTVFKKKNMHAKAIEVLLRNLTNLDRAREYAEKVAQPAVWSEVGKAELASGEVGAAVKSFIKADDPAQAGDVISAVQMAGTPDAYQHLVTFLQMARSNKTKDERLDTELAYAFARTEQHADLEEFLTVPNLARVAEVGERCYNEKLYRAAEICFQSVSNFPSLAKTLVRLERYQQALEAAQRAASTKTWREVCHACVEAKEFKIAAQAASHLVVVTEELDDLVRHYEGLGHAEEIINVLRQNLGSDRAHMGMFTELGILFAKHKPDKLMDHIKLYRARLNSHKLTVVCERFHFWGEIRVIHVGNDEWDSAARIMIEHGAQAWEHEVFKEVMSKVSSLELCYTGVRFYLEEHPEQINDYLVSVLKRIDAERVVLEAESLGRTVGADLVPILRPYLEQVQAQANLKRVNMALNRIYVEEEDYESLRNSIEQHDAIESLDLAAELHKHELMEMRRVGAWLYKKHGRYEQAIDISKANKQYGDAMQTAADSKDKKLVEDLVRYFTDNELHECFAACLFTCYEFIQPDVALELAWRHKVTDFAMPYIIQVLKEYVDKIDDISNQLNAAKKQAEEHMETAMPQAGQQAPLMITGGAPMGGMPMGGAPMGGAPMGGMGMGMGMPAGGAMGGGYTGF